MGIVNKRNVIFSIYSSGVLVSTEGSATQQNRVRDYVIFTILLRLHRDYAWITPGLHRDYTWFAHVDYLKLRICIRLRIDY